MRSNSNANKWILQGLNGIKDVKVSAKEEFFVGRYLHYARQGVSAEKRTTVFSNAPRLIIEAVTIAAMLGLVIIEMFMGKDISELMPQLSAFAVAAVRLLPSTNRISTSLSMAASGEPFLDSMIKTLKPWTRWNALTGHWKRRLPHQQEKVQQIRITRDPVWVRTKRVDPKKHSP